MKHVSEYWITYVIAFGGLLGLIEIIKEELRDY